MYGIDMFGYRPFGTAAQMLQSGDPGMQAAGENIAAEYGRDLGRERHEQGLQNAEQSRRQYDSETNRRRVGVLGGLLSGRMPMGGY